MWGFDIGGLFYALFHWLAGSPISIFLNTTSSFSKRVRILLSITISFLGSVSFGFGVFGMFNVASVWNADIGFYWVDSVSDDLFVTDHLLIFILYNDIFCDDLIYHLRHGFILHGRATLLLYACAATLCWSTLCCWTFYWGARIDLFCWSTFYRIRHSDNRQLK